MQIFGDPASWPDQDLLAISESADAELILSGYREGVFPMPIDDVVGWFSPIHRAILPLDGLIVRRSLRKSMARYHCTVDADFSRVIRACADPRRPHGWISPEILTWYTQLHRAGFAHSIEVWDDAGRLAGGLYGVRLGKLFCGESMFHDPEYGRDASKVALVRLVKLMNRAGDQLLDVQWNTAHLASLGACEIPRTDYVRLAEAASHAQSAPWAGADRGAHRATGSTEYPLSASKGESSTGTR